MKFIFMSILMASFRAFAIGCNCEVRVFPPMTGSYQMSVNVLKTYELEEYGSYALQNQKTCRDNCLKAYEQDMNTERLKALLLGYSEGLIQEKVLGYNCTGLTTLKFPVRVKAKLGEMGLGNVVDIVQVISHEEQCF